MAACAAGCFRNRYLSPMRIYETFKASRLIGIGWYTYLLEQSS